MDDVTQFRPGSAPVAPTHAIAVDGEVPAEETHHAPRAAGLMAIGLFKLGKATFFVFIGLGAMHLVHINLGNLALQATNFFHFDPVGHFASMLQDQADTVSGHRLRQVSLLSILYAGVSTVEGVGLMLQKTWAEYLTLTLTVGGLPLELYQIFKGPTPMKFGVLGFNLLILGYLLWFIRRTKRLGLEAA